jgi:hypothetical protein
MVHKFSSVTSHNLSHTLAIFRICWHWRVWWTWQSGRYSG